MTRLAMGPAMEWEDMILKSTVYLEPFDVPNELATTFLFNHLNIGKDPLGSSELKSMLKDWFWMGVCVHI